MMLPLREVDAIFVGQPAALLDIVHELRNLIVRVLPSAAEKHVWQGLAYFDPARGGVIKGGLCQISIKNQVVQGPAGGCWYPPDWTRGAAPRQGRVGTPLLAPPVSERAHEPANGGPRRAARA